MRFESDLGGAAVLKHHDDVSPASYHAVEAWAYSANEHHFTAAVTDNFGGVREFTSDGWSNDVLTWSSAPPISPAQQFIYTRLTGTSMRVDLQENVTLDRVRSGRGWVYSFRCGIADAPSASTSSSKSSSESISVVSTTPASSS
jgi:hypothetical protein